MSPPWHSLLETTQLEAQLQAWQTANPNQQLLALLAESDSDKLQQLQTSCLHLGIALAGGIFPRLLGEQGFLTGGAWLLPHAAACQPALLRINPEYGAADAARHMAQRVEQMLQHWPAKQGKPTLFMIFDGMLPDIASILDELYLQLADQVFYGGVNAGSESFQPIDCLFDQYQTLGHGVLCLLLPGSTNPVLNHGYPMPAQCMTATATASNRIFQIDWKPAFTAYQDIVKQQFGAELTRDNFYSFGVHFPLGIMLANQQVLIRIPVALEDDGSVFCVGEVPENAMLIMLQAPQSPGTQCVDNLLGTLRQRHGDISNQPLLTFYCAGRNMHFGPAALAEIRLLQANSQALPLLGALTLGEIGSLQEWGYPLFHNASIICSLWKQS
ncbi:FIST signal transduction protein [Aquitalea denitrificans]|uniref:FIST signal transduction protein n=1 Tax=Aquitalea denitrificans TaxID=519081 RepID=UPI00135A360C|nr:FIST C-terminal domain-containing protein [Aquitalea denitrificans]